NQIGEVDVSTHYGYDQCSAQTMPRDMRGCLEVVAEVR
ncbi:hypothetical protein A2U01_0074750, partial [Trifolium medium]|nr:hypothetical protein [Trifolium medium]